MQGQGRLSTKIVSRRQRMTATNTSSGVTTGATTSDESFAFHLSSTERPLQVESDALLQSKRSLQVQRWKLL